MEAVNASPRRVRFARRLCALLLVVTLAMVGTPGAAQADPAGPVSSERASSMPCADLLFVGARESGGILPYGAVIGPIRDRLRAHWRGTMREVYLDYPAADPHELSRGDLEGLIFDVEPPLPRYQSSVAQGVASLRRVLDDSTHRCPTEQVILAGLSQGAQVITETLSKDTAVPRLRGALLLGNPLHHPGQNVRELDGEVSSPAIGLEALLAYLRTVAAPGPERTREQSVHAVIGAVLSLYEGATPASDIAAALRLSPANIPAADYSHVFSVCLEGDMVCDAAGPLSRVLAQQSTLDHEFDIARPQHLGYDAAVVARSLEAILTASPPPMVTPSTHPASTPKVPPPSQSPPASPSPQAPLPVTLVVLGLATAVLVTSAYVVGRHRGRRSGKP